MTFDMKCRLSFLLEWSVSVLFERFKCVFVTVWLLVIMIKQCRTKDKWTGLCPKGQSWKAKMSSLPLILNKNLKASRSHVFSPICRNAFCRSPINKFDAILALTILSHKFGCSAGPLYVHSLMLFDIGEGRALQSNTILVLVGKACSRHPCL